MEGGWGVLDGGRRRMILCARTINQQQRTYTQRFLLFYFLLSVNVPAL